MSRNAVQTASMAETHIPRYLLESSYILSYPTILYSFLRKREIIKIFFPHLRWCFVRVLLYTFCDSFVSMFVHVLTI